MNRVLRDAVRSIREAGGKVVGIEHGGRHTRVRFVAADGVDQVATVHKGNIVTSRAEPRLRSQLRRTSR